MEFCWGLFSPRAASETPGGAVCICYSCRTTAGGQENQRRKEHQNYFLTHHKKQQRGKKTFKILSRCFNLKHWKLYRCGTCKSLPNKQELCKQLLEYYAVCSKAVKMPEIFTVFCLTQGCAKMQNIILVTRPLTDKMVLQHFPSCEQQECIGFLFVHIHHLGANIGFKYQVSAIRETLQLLLAIQQQASPSLDLKNLSQWKTYHTI